MKREEKNRTILRKREKEKMYNNIETKVYIDYIHIYEVEIATKLS